MNIARGSRKPLPICCKCKKEAACPANRFMNEFAGTRKAGVLLIKLCPTEEECSRRLLYVSNAGQQFNSMFSKIMGCTLQECTTYVLVKCCVDKVKKKHITNCMENSPLNVLMQHRKVVVCLGRDVLRYVFMRGAAPPSMDILLGHAVRASECKNPIITLPDPERLLDVDEDGGRYYDALKELQKKYGDMKTGLYSVRALLQGNQP